MGTRGAVGFRVNKEDKVTYNHSDSYPSGLGQEVLSFIRNNSSEDMKKAALNIELIDTEKKPTKKQIVQCMPWTNINVSEKSTDDWYCLLRHAQGNLNIYTDGFKYMNDSHDFLNDSLFCEYAYIINVDTSQLEFYSGFNKKSRIRKGRYASIQKENKSSNGYFGVALIWKLNFSDILTATDEEITEIIEKMEKKANGFYSRQEKELKKETKFA